MTVAWSFVPFVSLSMFECLNCSEESTLEVDLG